MTRNGLSDIRKHAYYSEINSLKSEMLPEDHGLTCMQYINYPLQNGLEFLISLQFSCEEINFFTELILLSILY